MVGIATTFGLIAAISFFSHNQEQTLLRQHESSMRRLADTVSEGLQSVMVAGSADIAQAFADRLKKVPDVVEFEIIRMDGLEAFRDNKTISNVNERRGKEEFPLREAMESVRIMPADAPDLLRAIETMEPVSSYTEDAQGNRQLVFLSPLLNKSICYRCHGKAEPVRGAVRLITSLAAVEHDIWRARQESFAIFSVALIVIVMLTGYLLGRIVVNPIERVTNAMVRVSGGDLTHELPVGGHDEMGRMGESFNRMTNELRMTYRKLRKEQDKLTTVIETATEGIVVTDADGRIVLVNPAVTALLGKSTETIVAEGFSALVNDVAFMDKCLQLVEPQGICFNGRDLQVLATMIHSSQNQFTGKVALLRDVSEVKRLEDDLRKASITDALTGLFNRRFLDATLESELVRAQRGATALSVMMIDVDHFKIFNDTHGHDQGDRVLQMVARCLREAARSFDFPCRYGGEEYLMILPGLGAQAALEMAEKFRMEVARTAVDGLNVHISLGVASFPDIAAVHGAALVEAADAALYRSKVEGRNRVTLATAST